MTDEKTIRCVTCRAEFTDAETEGASTCPTCGDDGVPMRIEDDIQLTLNTHELRILTIWANQWAAQTDRDLEKPHCVSAVGAICRRIREQVPGIALTMADEAKGLANVLDTKVTMTGPDGKRDFEPEKSN